MDQFQPDRNMIGFVQSLVARYAISGRYPAGTIPSTREFVSEMPLRPFATEDERAFRNQLECETSDLQKKIPGLGWGWARKSLNIFLRDCLYNFYLRREYGLESSGAFYEVPLDCIVGTELRKFDSSLPAWDAIKRLNSATSAKYQATARRIAQELGMSRVHLDARFWGARESFQDQPDSR